jgi:SAM-dependent methyltransferase
MLCGGALILTSTTIRASVTRDREGPREEPQGRGCTARGLARDSPHEIAVSRPSFVPEGARAWWPFVIGTSGARRPPAWNAHLLLWWGILEALLRIQPRKPREYWRGLSKEAFMHLDEVGKDHPSHLFMEQLVRQGQSVLDVGCGPGVNYALLASRGLASSYVGVDASEKAIEVAQTLHPAGDFRVGSADRLVHQFGERSFDVVAVRHVLEHLPDFQTSMQQAIDVSRHLAVFVFFLTPRVLPFNVRKVNLRYGAPPFLYVYSRPAIDRFLARSGLDFAWHYSIGASGRAGWFAGELNSALVVSRPEPPRR